MKKRVKDKLRSKFLKMIAMKEEELTKRNLIVDSPLNNLSEHDIKED